MGKAGAMEILWPALGISVIVTFVFAVLASHWQRILKQQSWMIRRLADRVRNLEEIGDPEFRRRLSESSPVPLEQVFTLSFRFSDRFWRDTLAIDAEQRKSIQALGSFVGSVKLDRWRSHTVATITEVLPESAAARWQTRSLDFYPDASSGSDALTLWELNLSRTNGSARRPPSLELVLRKNSVELRGHLLPHALAGSGNDNSQGTREGEPVFFRVPLDVSRLAEFRSHEPLAGDREEIRESQDAELSRESNGNSWRAFYSSDDEALGIEWQLWVRDLGKRAEWDRWKILDSSPLPRNAERTEAWRS
jgi:hypothetical protein